MTPSDILLKILDIIDFTEDKDAFVKKFMDAITVQALSDLAVTLPIEQQEGIKMNTDNPDMIKELLQQHFSQEQRGQALQTATTNVFADYIKSIDHSLSDTQRQKISSLSQQLTD